MEPPRTSRASPVLLAQVEQPSVAEIGGKAASLVRLTRAGFRVPDGAVLPASWFSAWWAELHRTDAWSRFAATHEAPWAEHCERLKAAAGGLSFTDEMRADLEQLRKLLASWDHGTCAVRSSSPDEDLEHASFAGGYATVLGVPGQGIEAAIRECFVSCLDERVIIYKAQHGFDVHHPRIAVLVQKQVESEVSGVGFSLNPMTNDYDEAVIEASFGLGETVVSGEVTPDHFIVDKPGKRILERRRGSKSVSRWVRTGGGVELRETDRSDESALSDAQVLELAQVLERVEASYGHPVDVEWAYAEGELQLLQARPVTAYVPLPPQMLTEPGARRRLYFDRGLSDLFTTNTPLTRLTLDSMDLFFRSLAGRFGIHYGEGEEVDGDMVQLSGSRWYVDYSKVLWWIHPARLAATTELMDGLLARSFANLDRARYKPERRPVVLSPGRMLRVLFGLVFKGGGVLWRTLLAFLSAPLFLPGFRRAVRQYEQAIAEAPPDASVSQIRALNDRCVAVLLEAGMPAIYPWFAATSILQGMRKRAGSETETLLDCMTRGFEGELVVDMGIEMFAMTRLLEASDFDDIEGLLRRILAREMPEPFIQAWDAFLKRYGCRGPNEMELRSPRYADSPALLLRQMSFMAKASPDQDPGAAHRKAVAERKQALAALLGRSGWAQRRRLRRASRWLDAYAAERDTPKHHMVMLGDLMRRKALRLGARLQAAGRLDSAADVFHLRWVELEAAERDPELDLGSLLRDRRAFFERVESQVKEFPRLIDSRGRILRPPPEADGDALQGLAISPGVARGPIKVLHDPYEKEVEPGDVLVAFTTDPGWTPLFVSASAIILQIGGVMQHGGVVAREYGKPCVAGIEHVLTRFEDGQVVEVDGSSGRVRLDP